jgi:hypothetical protein
MQRIAILSWVHTISPTNYVSAEWRQEFRPNVRPNPFGLKPHIRFGMMPAGKEYRDPGVASFPGSLLPDLRIALGIRRRGDRREFGWNRTLPGGWGKCRESALVLLRVEFTQALIDCCAHMVLHLLQIRQAHGNEDPAW